MTIKEKIEALARDTFNEIQRTENAYKAAEDARNAYPQRYGVVTAEYQAKAAKAEADYLEARRVYSGMTKKLPVTVHDQMTQLRREYSREMSEKYAVNPSKMDMAALELLKSGILNPDDYAAMMEKALSSGNITMARMVGKFAADAADAAGKMYGINDIRPLTLRTIARQGNVDPAAEALSNFDAVASIFSRCVNNPSMIDHWNELADPILDLL